MRTKNIVLLLFTGIVIMTGYFMFNHPQINNITQKISPLSVPEKPLKNKDIPSATEKNPAETKKRVTYGSDKTPKKTAIATEGDTELSEDNTTPESIKAQIYDIAVEYTDDLPLLDDIIQESAEEPLELWEGDWVSADDWKRKNDNFSIEKNEDGSFELIPEKNSTQSYSYSEATGEFVWERNYYGKIITHKARFISDDVMVLMKISGIKVALDIYRRDDG